MEESMPDRVRTAGDFAAQSWSRKAVEQTRTYVVQRTASERSAEGPKPKEITPQWETSKTVATEK